MGMGFRGKLPPRQWSVRFLVVVVVLGLLTPSAVSAVTYEPTNLQKGTIKKPANGTTVISIQGFHFKGQSSKKKPARLVGVGPRGEIKWVHNGSKLGAVWFYDVDPLDNGNLLVTATEPGNTLVYEYDPRKQEQVWVERFDIKDTHDVDLINGDELLVANLRAGDDDQIFVYNRTRDEVVWRWKFANHYNRSFGADGEDWTHVNDVDKIGDGRYLVSPRNFDQVIVVNRSTKEIELQLGNENDYDVLNEQHNPQYLESENGTPTLLVADSENDRVVEYARDGENWTRTWTLGDRTDFTWPRDADRLPNGNTLVVDTINHRVVEVTPTGEVVWEFYAPWAPYDVERITYGDEAGGPTIRDLNASGQYQVSGGAGITPGAGDRLTFSLWLSGAFVGTPVEAEMHWFAEKWSHVTPWIRPVWMSGWDFVGAMLAAVVLVGWLVTESVYHRHRLRTGVRRLVS